VNYGSKAHPAGDKIAALKIGTGCPYAPEDRAICDVSYYLKHNKGLNCRDISKGNCLGKVKCNTEGVLFTSGMPVSNGTANGEGGLCSRAKEGFRGGEDCFYDGQSETFKVCSGNPARKLLVTSKPTNRPSTRRPTNRPTSRKPTTIG
jgi:hypothetical protein